MIEAVDTVFNLKVKHPLKLAVANLLRLGFKCQTPVMSAHN